MRIVLVEDNVRIGNLVSDYLSSAGFAVDHAKSMSEFRAIRTTAAHTLYIVDLGLPDGDGTQIIKEVRESGGGTLILVTTARAGIRDRVHGLNCGADDYLVKPFHHEELLARVRALLRRSPILAPQQIRAGNIVLDCSSGEISCKGRMAVMRPSERRLLALLLQRTGRPVPRLAIENELISLDREVTPNAVEKVISRLRSALSLHEAGIEIKTLKGLGYILEERA